jgi:2-amino-4-hydroxy-6-hydroxymethyldihydropteridine diphosphokinase
VEILILIGLGANLPTEAFGPPRAGLQAALDLLDQDKVRLLARSRWFQSAPWPESDQPWFVNGVARLETPLAPEALLDRMLVIERRFGRRRGRLNAARVLDLDLLDYHGRIVAGDEAGGGTALTLPHPRMHERAFVLVPLAEVAPGWRHPLTGQGLDELIDALPPGQKIEALDAGPP